MDSPSPLSTMGKRKRDETTAAELEIDINAPEPPSKRAQRLAKKGRVVPPKPESPSPPPSRHKALPLENAEGHGNSETPVAKAQNPVYGIWIGNLNWTTDKAALRSFLMEHGNIPETSIARVHMPMPSKTSASNLRRPKPAKNKGFAYVDFNTKEDQTHAMGLSESLIDGRKLLIKDATNFEGRPSEHASNAAGGNDAEMLMRSGHPPNNRVFVGNLDFEADKDSVREHFEQCGEIDHAFVATFEDSGKCKGYAWITFADLEGAKNAVRGWVRKPKIGAEDGTSGANGAVQKAREKKRWVNVLANRRLRVEFAEDSNVRYQKRFRKGRDKDEHGSME